MSQSHRILEYLKSGRTLTPLEALRKFHTLRLSGRIFDLRQDGHNIRSQMVEVSGARVAEYRMSH